MFKNGIEQYTDDINITMIISNIRENTENFKKDADYLIGPDVLVKSQSRLFFNGL